jgi:hypothetical protein
MVDNLRGFDTVIAMPGFNSLYFWLGKEPPSTYNAGTWMTLLDDRKLQKVVERIEEIRSIGGMRRKELAESRAQGQKISSRPLVRFFEDKMHPFDQRGGIELLKRIERSND